jgi:glycogen synthase
VLDHSSPILSGYAVRSNSIMQAEKQLGMVLRAVTSPSHQLDDISAKDGEIDGIPFSRTALIGVPGRSIRKRLPLLRELSTVYLFRNRILEILCDHPVDVIHAHSPSLCGLAAWMAAKKSGVPLVYEIRGFWEDSAVDHGKLKPGSAKYRGLQRLETFVANHASAVVGIAANIVSEMAIRGVDRRKLFHVPNGVQASNFEPMARDESLAKSLGIEPEETVLGFIGSMWRFEGISWLVSAALELRKRGVRFKLIIVGHGEEEKAVRSAIEQNKISDLVLFVGRVPHHDVRRYYSVMDILVYPRRRIRLTEHVTPLKPLEAMAMDKCVLASSVGGLRELVTDGDTGLLFDPDDVNSFCEAATRAICNKDLRIELGQRARKHVLQEKDWAKLAEAYTQIYGFACQAISTRSEEIEVVASH